jgi:hypothetical protein
MKKFALSWLALALAWVGAGNTAQAAITITLTPSAASVAVGSSLRITASVTGAMAKLIWTVNDVTNGNSTYGTITGSYPSYTYTPPTAIPGGSNPVTVVATQAGTSQSASLSVTINPSATTPTAINLTGGAASVTGINFDLSSMATTLGLADIGTCGPPANPPSECSASVTGIQVSRSGAATADCPNTAGSLPATCSLWLLGQGLTRSPLTVSVTHGSTTDVTVSSIETTDAPTGYAAINFLIAVSGAAPPGVRNIVVTIGSGATQETQVYVGAIQIVN